MARYIELEQIKTVRYYRALLVKVPDGVEPDGLLRTATASDVLTHDHWGEWELMDEGIEGEIAIEHDGWEMENEYPVIFTDDEVTEITADIACAGRCGNG